MDTHIAGEPAVENAPTLRARLPGEPEPGLGEGMPDPPLRAGPRTVPPPASAPRSKRRGALLSGVAIVAVAGIVGGGFLVSPYNEVVPVPPKLRLAALRAETQIASLWHRAMPPGAARGPGGEVRTAAAVPPHVAHPTLAAPAQAPAHPLAPSAALAAVHPPAPPPAVVQPPYKPQSPRQELAEVLELGRSATLLPPAAPATRPRKGAPSHPPAAKPTAAASAGAASPAASPAPAGRPGGSVPRGPGAGSVAAATPAAGSVPPNSGSAGHPVAPLPSAKPGAPPVAQPAEKQAAGTAVRVAHGLAGVQVAMVSNGPAAVAAEKGLTAPATSGSVPAAAKTAPSRGKPVGPVPVESQPAAVHLAVVTPGDALGVAEDLRAAPMSSDQQVQVLELVTQLATLIRDERTEIANLQVDVRKSDGATAAKLSDFERRLSLVEADTAMAAASGPLTRPASAPGSAGSAGPGKPPAVSVALMSAKVALAGASRAPTTAPAQPPAPQVSSAAPKQYRVEAASPGLAMLAEVARGGGAGAQLEVQVGDTIPGYGRVLSVEQQGTNWVVQTEHGTIQ